MTEKLEEIRTTLREGMTHREIGEYWGRNKDQINQLLSSYNFQNPTGLLIELHRNLDNPNWKNERLAKAFIKLFEKKEIVYVPYEAFWRHGCSKSTDVDILVLLSQENINGKVDLVEIANRLSVDVKILDPVYITIEDNIIKNARKGDNCEIVNCCEIQNGLVTTYGAHNQIYDIPPLAIIPLTHEDIQQKIASVGKFFLDWFQHFVSPTFYVQNKKIRDTKFEGYWQRVEYLLENYQEIVNYSNEDDYDWKSYQKSLVMKLIQVILYNLDIYCYDKTQMVEEIYEIFNFNRDEVNTYLFRGQNYNRQILLTLFEHFEEITRKKYWYTEPELIELPINLHQNPTSLSNDLYENFLENPHEPSEEFIRGFNEISNGEICQHFIVPCKNIDKLPEKTQNHCVVVDPRTDEWRRLLRFYKCGNETEIKVGECFVTSLYYLIRGCIGEMIVMNNVDFSALFQKEVEKIVIGLFVDEIGKEKSPGCAPDLILKVNDDYYPVEIKTLKNTFYNDNITRKDTHREITLGKKQLKTAGKYLNSKKGILCFLSYEESLWICRAMFIDL